MTYESNVSDPPNILIVEDEKELAELYENWLQENDTYSIEMAHDVETAYWHFLEPIDIMILDRNLPGGRGGGGELLARIRDLGLDCRVVMVTAIQPTIDVLKLDFDDYLCKPVSEEELCSTVTRLLEQKQFKTAFTEYNRLRKKRGLVESFCTSSELAASEQYAALEDRLAELRAELCDATNSHPEISFGAELERVTSD